MVHEPVDGRRGELVVAEHRAPFAELDVRRHDQAPLLIAVAHHLEQQPRPFDVEGHVAELVEDEDLGFRQVPQHGLERMVAVRPDEHEHELRGREEAHRPAGLHARVADGDREMGLAATRLAVEDEVLGGVDEGERHELVGPVALRERDLREVVVVERLDLRERRLAVEPGALVALAHRLLAGDEVDGAPHLGRRRGGEELLDRLVREEYLSRSR